MSRDIDIEDLLKMVINYKWIITTIIIIAIFIGIIYLHFQPAIYSSHAILKIKTNNNKVEKSILLNPIYNFMSNNVLEDITFLKTFYMNNQALMLNKVNFKVQYYIKKGYEEQEIIDKIPIKITDINILNSKIIGKKVTLTPKKDGYTIQMKHSFLEKLKYKFLGKPDIVIEDKLFKYNTIISNEYFQLKVNKLSNFEKPITYKLNGNHRYIYENIIKKNLSISQVEIDVPIIKIAYKDNIQKRATIYVDSLTESLLMESIKNKTEQNKKVLEFIKKELIKTKEKLKKSEKELENYRVLNKVIKPSTEASTLIKELSEIDISLSENQLKKSLIQNIIKFIDSKYNLDAIAPSLMELDEKPTLNLIKILQESQLKRAELLIDFTKKHPRVQNLTNKIEIVQRKINLNIENLKKHISQKNKNLKKLRLSYEKKLKTLPIKERKLVNIQRDYEVSSTMYNFLLKKEAENEIGRVSTLSDYRIIDKAYGNSIPISPKGKIIIIVFGILGFVIGIIVVYIDNTIQDKIISIEDIKYKIDFPIYGIIPFVKNNLEEVSFYSNSNSYFSECYRTLRTNLQLYLNKNNSECKTILISSTMLGEGKNIVTTNLSAVLQMGNYRVITIDLDMRTPTLAKLFNIKNVSSDISNYLRGESSLNQIIYPTKYNNLHIIPTKNRPNNPSELILSSTLPKLIKELKNSYDYIIINSTPFGVISDTKHLMKISDINLVIFRENYSKKRFVSQLNNIINRDKVNDIGIIYIGGDGEKEAKILKID